MARFSNLERLAVLVDVQHLISQGPRYPAAVESLIRRLLNLGTRHTLWAFKFFDSSLTSLSAASKIAAWAGKGTARSHYSSSDPLDDGDEPLKRFRAILDNVVSRGEKGGEPRIEHISNACMEATSDFTWDPLFVHEEGGCGEESCCWPQPNLLLLLSTLNSEDPSSPKLAAAGKSFRERRIHACWILPPGEESPAGRILPSWSFTRMDTLIVGSFLTHERIVIPFMVKPSCKVSSANARLQVSIHKQPQHVCRVDVKPFFSDSCSRLGGLKKLRVTVAAVVPRRFLKSLSLKAKEEYLVSQQPEQGALIVDAHSTCTEELLQRLFPDAVFRQSELEMLLHFISSADGVGLVNVEVTDSAGSRSFQGILDPFTPVSARLTVGDAVVWLNKACGERSRNFSDVQLGGSLDEAWCRCLELLQQKGSETLQLKPSEVTYECPKALRAWNKQIRQRLKSPLPEINKWLSNGAAEVSALAGELPLEVAAAPARGDSESTRSGSRDEALKYLTCVREKLGSISFASVDVQTLVAESIEAVRSTSSGDEAEYQQLKRLLLVNPKKLASKYRKLQSSTRFQEFTLQIKLRLEILLTTELRQDREGLIEEICDLLSTIQFELPGGIAELEETIFQSRYRHQLGDTVKEIYARMELVGYGDTEADTYPSDGPKPGSGDGSIKLLLKENDESLQGAKAKMERARRMSHFSGRAQTLTFTGRRSCLRSGGGGGQEDLDEILVAATPMLSRDEEVKMMRLDEGSTPSHRTRRRAALGLLDHNLLPTKRKCFQS